MNQVPTTTEAKEVAVVSDVSAWGASEISSNDLVISKILPAQYTSEAVKEGDVKFMELYETSERKILGGPDKPLEFIPFHVNKFWMQFNITTTASGAVKRDFRDIVPITAANDNWQRTEMIDGVKVDRDRVLEFYVLLPQEIKDGVELPYILNFKRTSAKAGKQLMTQMFIKNRAADKNPAAVAMTLNVKQDSGDLGDYAVQTVKTSRESSELEQEAAFKWLSTVRTSNVKAVDEEVPF